MTKHNATNQKEDETTQTITIREFSDVVRCPYCTCFSLVSFEAWVKLRASPSKRGRCTHCGREFHLDITSWTFA